MSNGAGGPAPGAPPARGELGVGVGMGRWVPALGFVGLLLGPHCSGVGVMGGSEEVEGEGGQPGVAGGRGGRES